MEKVNQILKSELFLSLLKKIEEKESSREFCKHNLEHFLAVARISFIIDENKLDKEIIYAIALLHDIGKSESVLNHEEIGIKLASKILEETSFTKEQKEIILNGILNHKVGGDAYSNLIKKADTLSRNCFCCKMNDECKWEDTRKNKELTI